MVQVEVKEESVEVETVEHTESVPEVEAKKEVDIGKMMSSLSWSPLDNEKLEIHAEEILTGLLEKIPGLVVRTSNNQHQVVSYGSRRGRTVAKFWFTKKRIVLETAELIEKRYSVLVSRDLDEKIGLSKKVRSKVVAEIKAYISQRNWE